MGMEPSMHTDNCKKTREDDQVFQRLGMNMSATTSKVTDLLNHCFTEFEDIAKTWETVDSNENDQNKENDQNSTKDPDAIAIKIMNDPKNFTMAMDPRKKDPIIPFCKKLPGIERPFHYIDSLKRSELWFEQEINKQL